MAFKPFKEFSSSEKLLVYGQVSSLYLKINIKIIKLISLNIYIKKK